MKKYISTRDLWPQKDDILETKKGNSYFVAAIIYVLLIAVAIWFVSKIF